MTLWLSLCLLYSIDSPGSYSHVSLGFESFQQHSTAWLYLFPYKHLRRSTSEISKGNVLGYYRYLDSLRYGTSTAFLAVLWAALFSCFLRRNLRCGEVAAYIARRPPLPILAGYDGLHSHRLACRHRAIVHFFVLHEPMDVQIHCVI